MGILYSVTIALLSEAADKVHFYIAPPANAAKTVRVVRVRGKTAASSWFVAAADTIPTGGTDVSPSGDYYIVSQITDRRRSVASVARVKALATGATLPVTGRNLGELSTSSIADSIDTFVDEWKPNEPFELINPTDCLMLVATGATKPFIGTIEWTEEP